MSETMDEAKAIIMVNVKELARGRNVARADADRLADALEALGLDGDCWHYFACPTRHNFLVCDAKCIAARKALRLHKEQGE